MTVSERPKFRATIWFEQRPDCYGGKTCDKVVPRWHCYADDDKDSDYQNAPLKLNPKSFPPGTKITVEEPTCPECGETRPMNGKNRGPLFDAKCDCGFDWEAWTLNEYS